MPCTRPWIDLTTGEPRPCRKCPTCRLNAKQELVTNINMEARLHQQIGWLTKTYDDQHLPEGGSLCRRDDDLWMHRLRKAIDYRWPGRKIRYVRGGQYGRQTGRPHYHHIIFGLTCHLKYRRANRIEMPNGGWLCGCDECVLVRSTWDKGNIDFRMYTADRADYLAGYMFDGVRKAGDPKLKGRDPEFISASNRPGIGMRTIPDLAVQFMTREDQLNAHDRSYLDIPNGYTDGRRFNRFNNYRARALRLACGRPPGAPDEIRAAGLAANHENNVLGWRLATTPGHRMPLNRAIAQVIHDKNIQGERNRLAKCRFRLRRRF